MEICTLKPKKILKTRALNMHAHIVYAWEGGYWSWYLRTWVLTLSIGIQTVRNIYFQPF